MHMLAKPTLCHGTLLAISNTCKLRLKCISMHLIEEHYEEKGEFFNVGLFVGFFFSMMA